MADCDVGPPEMSLRARPSYPGVMHLPLGKGYDYAAADSMIQAHQRAPLAAPFLEVDDPNP